MVGVTFPSIEELFFSNLNRAESSSLNFILGPVAEVEEEVVDKREEKLEAKEGVDVLREEMEEVEERVVVDEEEESRDGC